MTGSCVSKSTILMVLLISGFEFSSAQAKNYRKLSKLEATSHVLNRMAFGPRTDEVREVIKMSWRKWVEQQLNPQTLDDNRMQQILKKKCPSLKLSMTQLQKLDRKQRRRVKKELTDSVLLRAVYSKRQFKEVMVEFWRDHFNVDVNKVAFLATHYEENVLRSHVFGKFEDLLMATAKHPAMLVYLDNYVSRNHRLNENYARELMELHTLGVDNGYTQKDVIELARVLTGWTCGWRGQGARREYIHFFNARVHDNKPATVVGLKLNGMGGESDGEKVIRYFANHPKTARFISTKLCRFLVNDEPSENLLNRVTAVFLESGGDLRKVYRAIVFSPEFMDVNNYRAKFKTPLEFMASTLRATDARIASTTRLNRALNLMGQPTYECLEPTGYNDSAEAWLDPGVMIYRWNFALDLVRNKVKGVKIGKKFVKNVLESRSQMDRTRRVIMMVIPGANDPFTKKLVSRASDIRVMVAAALGSPSFQQQ